MLWNLGPFMLVWESVAILTLAVVWLMGAQISAGIVLAVLATTFPVAVATTWWLDRLFLEPPRSRF